MRSALLIAMVVYTCFSIWTARKAYERGFVAGVTATINEVDRQAALRR